ncbi:hypothetical protein QTG54_002750 [Skeletonema marinoi]|uniref:Uncharacterized protein n=1 Tax=Skeletonema marinoi TaxID=267567 RepID=A0AAD9DHU0_9STRA|nr:hypothetical protein QTG54_002750 [Skeletonema marinoi]
MIPMVVKMHCARGIRQSERH